MISETCTSGTDFELDEGDIVMDLNTKGEVQKEGIYLKVHNKQNERENFLCKLSHTSPNENFSYEGFYDNYFLRSSFGKYVYPNGDLYIGTWKDDKRDGRGIYLHKDGNVYCGLWKEGRKEGLGIQFWRPADCPDNIQAFVGRFDNDYYHHGLYLSDIQQNPNDDIVQQNQCAYNYIYFGEFNDDGTKEDDFCFLLDMKRDFLFYGRIKRDRADEGFQIKFERSINNLKGILYYRVSPTEDKVDFLIKPECIDDEVTQDIYDKSEKFMDAFFFNNQNYFKESSSIYYDLLTKISEFKEGINLDNMDIISKEAQDYINKVLQFTSGVKSFLNRKSNGQFNFNYLN